MLRRLIILLLITSHFAREYIAVIDFEGINVSEGDAKALVQHLTSEMIELGMYQVFERSELFFYSLYASTFSFISSKISIECVLKSPQ